MLSRNWFNNITNPRCIRVWVKASYGVLNRRWWRYLCIRWINCYGWTQRWVYKRGFPCRHSLASRGHNTVEEGKECRCWQFRWRGVRSRLMHVPWFVWKSWIPISRERNVSTTVGLSKVRMAVDLLSHAFHIVGCERLTLNWMANIYLGNDYEMFDGVNDTRFLHWLQPIISQQSCGEKFSKLPGASMCRQVSSRIVWVFVYHKLSHQSDTFPSHSQGNLTKATLRLIHEPWLGWNCSPDLDFDPRHNNDHTVNESYLLPSVCVQL